MECPLCSSEISDAALVCPSCGRDIAVLPELLVERDLLLARRTELKSKLEDVQSRIAQKRKPVPPI